MNKLLQKIKIIGKSKTIQNISKMMTGTLFGQILSIVLVPITTRLYGAEAYGDLAVLTSASSVFVSFLGFGLASAIMVEKTDEEAEQTYKMAVNLTNVLVVLIIMLLMGVSPWFQLLKSSLPYNVMLIMVGFYVVTTNQVNMLYAWLNRKGRYNVLLFNPMISPMVNNGLAIILGVIGFKGVGLYIGLLFSQFVTLIHMFKNMDPIRYRFRFCDIPEIVKRNKDFILYQYPASLMNTVVSNLPVQILSFCFGNTMVGYYSMAMKLLNIPSNIISSSMSRVYFKEVSDKQREGKNSRLYTLKMCKIITAIYLFPMAIIILLGDILIPFFLGGDWSNSVTYIKIMAVWNLFAIAINCTAGFPSVIKRQKSNMIISAVKLVVFPVAMLLVSNIFAKPQLTVWVYAISYSIINTAYYECLIGEDKTLRFKYVGINILCLFVCILFFLISFGINKML